jgi:hypothetical protein
VQVRKIDLPERMLGFMNRRELLDDERKGEAKLIAKLLVARRRKVSAEELSKAEPEFPETQPEVDFVECCFNVLSLLHSGYEVGVVVVVFFGIFGEGKDGGLGRGGWQRGNEDGALN